jgi:hypothetical protein
VAHGGHSLVTEQAGSTVQVERPQAYASAFPEGEAEALKVGRLISAGGIGAP